MKRIALLLTMLFTALALVTFAGCADKKTDPATVRVIMPDGAPALAFASQYRTAEAVEEDGTTYLTQADAIKKGYTVRYSLGAESAIATMMAAGKADVAIMPTNAAANIYNKGAKVKLVSVNVHGLLYMLGNEKIEDLSSLKGKVVYSIGEGGTPDYVFRYIMQANGIECVKSDEPVEGKVAMSYVEGGSALVPLLKQGKAEFGIVGEPVATKACAAASKVVALDLQEQWKLATKKQEGTELALPQASLVVSDALIENHPAFVEALLSAVSDGENWLNQNPAQATEAMKTLGSAVAAANTFTAEIIGRCNIHSVLAANCKQEIETYLTVLKNFKPAAIGDNLPDGNFYYSK